MAAQPVNVRHVSVYLTHEQHQRLQKLKERTGAPVSESIRRAIDAYLKAVERFGPGEQERLLGQRKRNPKR